MHRASDSLEELDSPQTSNVLRHSIEAHRVSFPEHHDSRSAQLARSGQSGKEAKTPDRGAWRRTAGSSDPCPGLFPGEWQQTSWISGMVNWVHIHKRFKLFWFFSCIQRLFLDSTRGQPKFHVREHYNMMWWLTKIIFERILIRGQLDGREQAIRDDHTTTC